MRKIRDGLNIVGLPAEVLLRHGNARVVYGVSLAENFREVLLGFTSKPKYLLPLRRAAIQTEKLAGYWRRRWLLGRIQRPDVLNQVTLHTLTYPILHGARVRLDEISATHEEALFDFVRHESTASTPPTLPRA
jgi:hypothetical protein